MRTGAASPGGNSHPADSLSIFSADRLAVGKNLLENPTSQTAASKDARLLTIDQHRTDQVLEVIQRIVDAGQTDFRPGHIADELREEGLPLLSWEIRGELSRLAAEGLIEADPATGNWSLTPAASRKAS